MKDVKEQKQNDLSLIHIYGISIVLKDSDEKVLGIYGDMEYSLAPGTDVEDILLGSGITESYSCKLTNGKTYWIQVFGNKEKVNIGLESLKRILPMLGADVYKRQVMFRELYSNSAFYILSRRCGIDPMEYLEEEHFFGITDFNRLSVLSFLGNAVSQLVEPILMDIGKTIRKIQMEEQEKTVADQNYIGYNEFNTLIRKSKSLSLIHI